jgi:hypothetical protein
MDKAGEREVCSRSASEDTYAETVLASTTAALTMDVENFIVWKL